MMNFNVTPGFLYMRNNFVRKYISPTKRQVDSFLTISENNKTEHNLSYLMYVVLLE